MGLRRFASRRNSPAQSHGKPKAVYSPNPLSEENLRRCRPVFSSTDLEERDGAADFPARYWNGMPRDGPSPSPALPPTSRALLGMRWWLGLAFAVVAGLTA